MPGFTPKMPKPTAIPKLAAMPRNNLEDVRGKWGTEIRQENRRLTGVTPHLLGAYTGSPARLLPRSHALSGLGRMKKVSVKGKM